MVIAVYFTNIGEVKNLEFSSYNLTWNAVEQRKLSHQR